MWDLGLIKNITSREGIRLQLRGEAEGAVNTRSLYAPDTRLTSTLFRQVRSTQTGQEERRISVGLKLIF